MIAAHHGHPIDVPTLRQRFPQSVQGGSLSHLAEIGHSLGLNGRAVRFELSELAQLTLPCVLHWRLNHFVVLRKVTKTHIVVNDPAHGSRRVAMADASRDVTGVALEFSKGPAFQRVPPPPPISIRKLAGSVTGLARSLTMVFVLALVLEVFSLLWPQLVQLIADQVLADGDRDLLSLLGMSFFLVLAAQTAVGALRSWTMTWLSTSFQVQWGANVFQHLLRLPQLYFLKRHLGDIVSRYSAVASIQETITSDLVGVLLDGLMAVVTLSMMFLYSATLAGIALAALAVYLLIRSMYYRFYFESNLSQVRVAAQQQSTFLESIRGVQTLRINNKVADQTGRFINALTDTSNTAVAVQRLGVMFGAMSTFTSGAQRIAVLWIGASIALKGQMTIGMLMAFTAYADQFSSRGMALVDSVIHLRLLSMQAERLADIVLHPVERHVEGNWSGPDVEGDVQFHGVSFRYSDTDPWIVKDLSFTIRQGESVAIAGPSGCGKSTVARLLLGLLDPITGVISVGGVDIRQLGKQRLRAMAAGVLQDDTLFSGTIAENISFFDAGATNDGLSLVARMAGIHEEILKMPMGYRTVIGDMGGSLSGGQIQRLLLARALYRRPSILILDEATSHLDSARERQINHIVASLKMTKIIIAHRTETLASADRVVSLTDAGMLVRQTA
jgi:ATP-binding cassette subfamily B protein RaxB